MDAYWVIEVTRKCKLSCSHCLRGKAENVSMSASTFRAIVDNLSMCNATLSGGEPLLNLAVLKEVPNTEIGDLSITTSGVITFPNAVMRCLCAIRDKKWMDLSMAISTDKFHTKCHGFKELLCMWGIAFHDKDTTEFSGAANIGNAYDNGIGVRPAKEYLPVIEHDGYGDRPTLIVNVFGDIYPGCDYSYRMMREFKKELCLGNALKSTPQEIAERYMEFIGGKSQYLIYDESGYYLTENFDA